MNNSGDFSRADQFLIVASVGRDLPEFCANLGVDIKTFAEPLQIDVSLFEDFEAKISFDKFCRLLEVLATIVSDDTFGLRFGQFYKQGGSGAFGLGLRVAPTFKDMLNFYSTYESTLVDLDHFNLIIERDRFTIDWSYSPLITQREQFVDFVTAAVVNGFQRFSERPLMPIETHLERRPPRVKLLHKKIFPKKLTFNALSNRLVFSSDVLTYANPNADPLTFEFMRQKCGELLKKQRRDKDVVTLVKEDIIRGIQSADFGIEKVAQRCGMSERTLQRRLGELGTSFAELFDHTRDELSLELLSDESLPLSEVSYRLGYSSQSAYTRAVKRLHGVSPGALRGRLK
ncbi:MAG: AraC family transcriptional regulator ligand-binding domain-containing protein [Roseobacter sp.]